MDIYHYNRDTGELMDQGEARLDPIERKPMIPANATKTKPPTTKENEVAIFDGSAWSLVPDHRGYAGFDSKGEEQKITDLNIEPDPNWTVEQPFILEEAKIEKIADTNNAVAAEIVSGFYSTALGSKHLYQSEREDQLNLLGLASSGADLPFKCSADDGANWSYVLHTARQLKKVMSDGITHKLTALQKGEASKARVKLLPDTATQADIDAIK